jgi:tetratricopeptide (TPR) repeat protein
MIVRAVWIAVFLAAFLVGADDLASALASGRYQQVLQTVEPLLSADTGTPRLWALKGIALRGLGRTVDSLVSFDRALAISPKMLPALEGAAESAFQLRDSRVQSYLNRILELDGRNQTAHAMAGALAFEAHDCRLAVQHFENSHAAIEQNTAALMQFGACLVELKRPQDASEVFRKAVNQQPSNHAARYDLALSQNLAGHPDQAITTLQLLVEQPSPMPDVLNLLAAAYDKTGHVNEAIAALRRATEVAPREEQNYLDLAAICMEHQAAKLAVDVLDAGIANNPASSRLHAARGAMLAQLGRLEDAQAEFELADTLDPDQVYGSLGLSTLYQEVRRTDDAVALLRRKLILAPDDYRLNYLLADALLHGVYDPSTLAEARTALERATRAKPDFAKAHSSLGKLYTKTGDLTRAVQEFRMAVSLDPADRAGLNQLQLALRRLGLHKESAAIAAKLKNAIEADRAAEIASNKVKLR